jgi:hypothetical protein
MFCPKCSQPQTSNQLRFCPRCGFHLEEVRALVQSEETPATDADSRTRSILPSQKDISIGAGLMFAGGIVATLWSFFISAWPLDVALPQAFFILGFTLAFVLLFFHPLVRALHKQFADKDEPPLDLSGRQNGINLGAILMFIGALKAMLLTTMMEPSRRGWVTLLSMAGGFLVLLFLRPIIETVYNLLFRRSDSSEDKPSTADTSDLMRTLPANSYATALPPAQSIPVNTAAITSNLREPHMAQPPSVTEHSTELLNKE